MAPGQKTTATDIFRECFSVIVHVPKNCDHYIPSHTIDFYKCYPLGNKQDDDFRLADLLIGRVLSQPPDGVSE